ncbi:hypothetical protein Tdes44962_MAKER08948 [Teratosphaeria destructans]|uniref:Uncharacterized protein n=1 Tax=Teratosphaeria destructans TaxID=418781 RepID=A0A9W7SUV8_9PEZI|nr:hypothetical protein Tdes44962_MAKER08948 [Teratosphaeria destructans]
MQLTTVLLAAFTGMAAAQYNATTTAGYCPSQSQPSGGYTYGSNNPWPYASATAPSNSTGANATSSNSPAYYTGAASNLNAQSLGAVVLGGFAVAVAAL